MHQLEFLGFSIDQLGYQGQVLPVLVASWVLAKIEVWLRNVFTTPFSY